MATSVNDLDTQAQLLRLIAKAIRKNDPALLEWAADELDRQLAAYLEKFPPMEYQVHAPRWWQRFL